jgi:hypothetical protein
VNKIFSKVRDQNGQKELQKPGQSRDESLKAWNAQIPGELNCGQQNQKRQDLYREMSGHEVDHIQSPLVAKRSLLWTQRPEPLKGHVNSCCQKQIKQKPVEANRRAIVKGFVNPNA